MIRATVEKINVGNVTRLCLLSIIQCISIPGAQPERCVKGCLICCGITLSAWTSLQSVWTALQLLSPPYRYQNINSNVILTQRVLFSAVLLSCQLWLILQEATSTPSACIWKNSSWYDVWRITLAIYPCSIYRGRKKHSCKAAGEMEDAVEEHIEIQEADCQPSFYTQDVKHSPWCALTDGQKNTSGPVYPFP